MQPWTADGAWRCSIQAGLVEWQFASFGGCDAAEARARAYAGWLRAQFAGEQPEAVRLLLNLIRDCQMVLSHYLRPDGLSADQTIGELLRLLDGSQWRVAEKAAGIVGCWA